MSDSRATSNDRGPARTTRPRLVGGICLTYAIVFVAIAGLLFWAVQIDGYLLGAALVATALAALAALIGVLGLQVAQRTDSRALTRPLLTAALLVLGVGIVGSGISAFASGAGGSVPGMFASVSFLPASLLLVVLGALLHGTAKTSS